MLYQRYSHNSNRFIPTEGIYDRKLLKLLKKQFGTYRRHHIDMSVSNGVMSNLLRKMQGKNPRQGEVVMVVPNKSGKVWLHTKASYPDGVYRLMSGGLEPDELPHKALDREVEEETGFKVNIDCCLAVITYSFRKNGLKLPFTSYIFLTKPTCGTPVPTDSGEAITGFKAVPAKKLSCVARELRSMNGRFAEWGVFRAEAHEVAGDILA